MSVDAADRTGGDDVPTTQAVAPDTTAPAAPTGGVSADGTSVNGTGEPGATITVRQKDANKIVALSKGDRLRIVLEDLSG